MYAINVLVVFPGIMPMMGEESWRQGKINWDHRHVVLCSNGSSDDNVCYQCVGCCVSRSDGKDWWEQAKIDEVTDTLRDETMCMFWVLVVFPDLMGKGSWHLVDIRWG